MIQEIIVFALFGLVIGYYLYRFFIKKETPAGGCDKCDSGASKPSIRDRVSTGKEKKPEPGKIHQK